MAWRTSRLERISHARLSGMPGSGAHQPSTEGSAAETKEKEERRRNRADDKGRDDWDEENLLDNMMRQGTRVAKAMSLAAVAEKAV